MRRLVRSGTASLLCHGPIEPPPPRGTRAGIHRTEAVRADARERIKSERSDQGRSGASRREPLLEADEVVDIQHRGRRAPVTVRVGGARGEPLLETDEVIDVQDWRAR